MKYYEQITFNKYCRNRFIAASWYAKACTAMLFLIVIAQFNSSGQILAHPSCNISGPLEAVASGPDMVITVQIAHSSPNPALNYTFSSNTSNAYIKLKGPINYNAATNMATQQLTVSPGNTGSDFNLKLEVTTAAGVSACSKSVSVSSPVVGGTGAH